MMKCFYLLLLTSILSLNSFAQSFNGPTEEIELILANIDSFSHYFVTNQTEKLVSCYTTDGKILPSGSPIQSGKEKLERYWKPNGKSQVIYHKIYPEEITIVKNTAYDIGYYEGKTRLENGSISTWKGKYVIIWKKIDGFWKIDVDIWNNVNLPKEVNIYQSLLDSMYRAHDDTIDIMIHIEQPSRDISWSSAAGYSVPDRSKHLVPNQPLLIASNTKTFVAASIMKLMEKGMLDINDNIKSHLTENTERKLNMSGYETKAITLKHLLSHTSGINDYVNRDYFELVDSLPQKQWTREEQIQLAVDMGVPFASPGVKYSYADINFVLLSEIIEVKTKKNFYIAIRELLDFEKLGINNTWFAQIEDAPSNHLDLAHQYNSKMDWDSYEINPSWDLYGGGGLISTTKDLAIFFHALFNGHIIKDKSLVALMHTYVLPADQSNYGLGVMILDFDGYEAYYHGGYWGTNVIYFPEFDMSIASFTLDREDRKMNSELTKAILSKVQQLDK